jgi:copper transport protein
MCLVFFFPMSSQAQAILVSSDPAKDAILLSPPSEVRMQFGEDLSPSFSTAVVVNAANHRVDQNDAHISPDNSREMDISLKLFLPSDVYVVVWQTRSADDGQIVRGSFVFKVLASNGNIPSLNGTYPGQNALGGGTINAASDTGQMDGPTLFSLITVILVDLSTVFWVGAQLWLTFVSQPLDTSTAQQYAIDQRADRRFALFFSIPTLLVAFIANLGVLIGQGLLLTGGNFIQVLPLFGKLMVGDRFGTFWIMREIVILLALSLAIYIFWSQQRPRIVDGIISWINLALGLALVTAVVLSSSATTVSNTNLVYAVLADWLHLLAASLWIGGMMYLAVSYLPVLKGKELPECIRALLTMLPHFSLLAIAGMVIMALTGPFDAGIHLSTLDQLITTAYGRALLVKIVCVGALLLTSAIHMLYLRPRLDRTLDAYLSTRKKADSVAEAIGNAKDIKDAQITEEAEKSENVEYLEESPGESIEGINVINHQAIEAQFTVSPLGTAPAVPSQEVKALEESLASQTRRLTRVLRWEPMLGVAVLICTGLMNVFAGTLPPVAAQQNQSQAIQQSSSQGKPFNTTVQTTDSKFKLKLAITPNSFGTNLFTVHVLDNNGKQDTNVKVSVYLTMLDMDMGTELVNLQPDDTGGFGAEGDLSMLGNWQMRLEVRTPDNTLHEVTLKFVAPY